MIEVQDTVPAFSVDPVEAVRQIHAELNRMQQEIWQLRNLPLQPRTVTGYHVENGEIIWDQTV